MRTRGAQLLYCASCRCWLCFDVSCTRCTQELAASVSKIHLRFTSSSLLRELLPPSSHLHLTVCGVAGLGSRRRPAGGTCTVIVVSHRAARATADRRVRVDVLSLSVEPPRPPIPPRLTRAAIVPAAHPSTQRRLCLLRCKGEGRPERASRATSTKTCHGLSVSSAHMHAAWPRDDAMESRNAAAAALMEVPTTCTVNAASRKMLGSSA